MRVSWKLLLVMLFVALLIAQSRFPPLTGAQIPGKVTIWPTDDSYVDSIHPTSNYGTQDHLNVSAYNGLEPLYERVVWLKFNLSEVPDGAVITSAVLQLNCTEVQGRLNVSAHFSSNNSWKELTITFANQPEYNLTTMPDLCQTCGPASWTLVSVPGPRLWDVTYAVNKTVDGIHGGVDMMTIVLTDRWRNSTEAEATFFSKEESLLARRPKLTVAWSHIVPEFPQALFLPALIIAASLVVAFHLHRTKAHARTRRQVVQKA